MKLTNYHLGVIVVGLILVAGIGRFLMKKTGLIEGMTNPSETEFIAKGIGNDLEGLKDSLLINKYNSNYKTIVEDLMKWCDLAILNGLINSKLNIQDGISQSNTEIVSSFNQYADFKNTLQQVYDNLL